MPKAAGSLQGHQSTEAAAEEPDRSPSKSVIEQSQIRGCPEGGPYPLPWQTAALLGVSPQQRAAALVALRGRGGERGQRRTILHATHPAPTGRVATGPTEGNHAGLLQPGPARQEPFSDPRGISRSSGIRGAPEGIPPAPGDLREIPCTDRGTVCHQRLGPNPPHGKQLETGDIPPARESRFAGPGGHGD